MKGNQIHFQHLYSSYTGYDSY